jgi:hypothetical protein
MLSPGERLTKTVGVVAKAKQEEVKSPMDAAPSTEPFSSNSLPVEEEKSPSAVQAPRLTLLQRRASRIHQELRSIVVDEISCRSAGSSNKSEDSDGDARKHNHVRSSSVCIREIPARTQESSSRKQAIIGNIKAPPLKVHRMSTGEVVPMQESGDTSAPLKGMSYLSKLAARTTATGHKRSTFCHRLPVARPASWSRSPRLRSPSTR